jgi:hypothetical protein
MFSLEEGPDVACLLSRSDPWLGGEILDKPKVQGLECSNMGHFQLVVPGSLAAAKSFTPGRQRCSARPKIGLCSQTDIFTPAGI